MDSINQTLIDRTVLLLKNRGGQISWKNLRFELRTSTTETEALIDEMVDKGIVKRDVTVDGVYIILIILL